MSIIHVRIDDRLIHGQVAVVWTNTLQASRIMVVNNNAAGDDMQKSILKMATPPGAKLSVLSVDKAVDRIKEGRYDSDRVFMILKNPSDVLELIKRGIDIKEVNVGNMANKGGTTQIKKSISISEEDLKAFLELNKMGVKLTARMIPNEGENDLMDFIKQKGLV